MIKPLQQESFDREAVTKVAKKQLNEEVEKYGLEKEHRALAEVKMLFKGMVEEKSGINLSTFKGCLFFMKMVIKEKTGSYPVDLDLDSGRVHIEGSYSLMVDNKLVNIFLKSKLDESGRLQLKLVVPSNDKMINQIKAELNIA